MKDHAHQPIKILHVVGILQRGGIETWLMHVLRHMNRDRFAIDVLVQTEQPGAYDSEVKALGCNLFCCPIHRSHPFRYARQFKQILQEHGPYDIVHSHVHRFSGFTLKLAHQAQVPMRIAHSHNDTSMLSTQMTWRRHMYVSLMNHWINQHATVGLAASKESAQDLFGKSWTLDPRWQVLYYGIDLSTFSQAHNPNIQVQSDLRAELGIPEDAIVVGHIGRFEPQKNHSFLVNIALEVFKRNPKTYFLLIGDGPLRSKIEAQVNQMSYDFREHLIFAGVRSDISRLMLSVIDVLILPSLYEGLPVVGIEAQSANLPIVISDVITSEMDALPELIHRVSLQKSASIWADVILAAHAKKNDILSDKSRENKLANTPFNINFGVSRLEKIYSQKN